jgi:hypothetical protein
LLAGAGLEKTSREPLKSRKHAWAGCKERRKLLGLGHQAAFFAKKSVLEKSSSHSKARTIVAFAVASSQSWHQRQRPRFTSDRIIATGRQILEIFFMVFDFLF